MPSKPGSVCIVLGFDDDVRVSLPLETLTAAVRAYRGKRMAISRDELKAKRLAAMGVVGAQHDASAAMYDEVIAYGDEVNRARENARTATLNAMDAEMTDLKEMADDHAEFAQAANPTTGAKAGTVSSTASVPAKSAATAALAALMASQPNPPAARPEGWKEGDAYVETRGEHPPEIKS